MDNQIPIPLCPICKSKMILRTARKTGRKFWGCSRFSKGCRGSRSYKKPALQRIEMDFSNIILSKYQQDALDFFLQSEENMLLEATAGSGKSFLLMLLLHNSDKNKKSALLSFNADIARSNASKAPENVRCSTISALGRNNVLKTYPHLKNKVDKFKLHKILDAYYDKLIEQSGEERVKPYKSARNAIINLVDLLKANLFTASEDNIAKLKEKHSLEWDSSLKQDWVYDTVKWLHYSSIQDKSMIDFSDMIDMCLNDNEVNCEKFDLLLVDEAQDLSPSFIEFVQRSIKQTGRIIVVGDRYQSIYAFRAADSKAMDNLKNSLEAKVLPLSMTYRNSKAVVENINQRFPHIKHEALSNAPEGKVDWIKNSTFTKIVKEGDMVLCRNNAPLVKPALMLLAEGIKAVIKGKEIGVDLERLIEKVIKSFHAEEDIASLLAGLEIYEREETAKLIKLKYVASADTLSDKVEAIVAMTYGLKTIDQLLDRIATIFSETQQGVTFSSIHKAKGLEAENVFILKPELMPSKRAITDEDIQQEENCEFVALSRPKLNLFYVEKET